MLTERQIVIILVMWLRSRDYMWVVKYKIFLNKSAESQVFTCRTSSHSGSNEACRLDTLQGNIWRLTGTYRPLDEEPSPATQSSNMANWFRLQ